MSLRGRILTTLAALLLPFFLQGQTLSQQQARRSALERDIAILRSQISSSESKSEQALGSLSLIQADVSARKKLLRSSDLTLEQYGREIRSVKGDIRHLQSVLDTLEAHYYRLVLGAYKNRSVKAWYMYILSADDVSQAFRRFGYFKSLSSQISLQAKHIQSVKEDLQARQKDLEAVQRKEQKVRDERAKQLTELQKQQAAQQKLVKKLRRNTSTYKASLKAKQKEMRAIERSIEKMLREASDSGRGRKKKEVDYTLAASFEKNKGKLPWPVEGPVTEHFGPYQNKELKLSLVSNGINIACPEGTHVKAVFDGVVSNVMLAPGYGQCILIQHGNYYTTYCKVKTAFVHKGEKVTTGQEIGEVATIMGRTQLYFLIWKTQYLDPEKWLRDR